MEQNQDLARVVRFEPSALAAGLDASNVERRRPAASAVGSQDALSRISKHVLSMPGEVKDAFQFGEVS